MKQPRRLKIKQKFRRGEKFGHFRRGPASTLDSRVFRKLVHQVLDGRSGLVGPRNEGFCELICLCSVERLNDQV